MKPFKLAIVGATGLVGQTFLDILEKKAWPITSITLFASSRSLGKDMLFKGEKHAVKTIEKGCFLEVDYALFSINGQLSKTIAKQAVSEGCVVIDNSSAFRFDDDIPLVVPSVNGALAENQRLIANPNCSTIQAVIPLAVLASLSPIESVAYHTYQSVSGSGHKGVLALTRKLDYYPVDITQTVLPQIDSMMDDGYTFEEVKMIKETKKILNDSNLLISATCVRVPIERGHGVSVSVVTQKKISLESFKKALKKHPMIELKTVPSTVDVARQNKVQVGRLRTDHIHPNGLLFYVAADNLYVGAAANAIDILERVIR
jgi:aspartate-semialdehyde dehydrogenase